MPGKKNKQTSNNASFNHDSVIPFDPSKENYFEQLMKIIDRGGLTLLKTVFEKVAELGQSINELGYLIVALKTKEDSWVVAVATANWIFSNFNEFLEKKDKFPTIDTLFIEHLTAKFERNNLKAKETLIGGESDYVSVSDLAKKYNVTNDIIELALDKGRIVEMEHTDNPVIAHEISKDHISERLDYYDMLQEIEQLSIPETEAEKESRESIFRQASGEVFVPTQTENFEIIKINNTFVQQLINEYYDTSTTSNNRSRTIIKKTISFLRGSHEANTREKFNDFKKKEVELLKKFISQNDFYYNTANLGVRQQDKDGAEHLIYYNKGYAIKLNNCEFYNSWFDYLINILIHNNLFAATKYELLGFCEIADVFYSVVKQRYIEKTESPNLLFVKNIMQESGFINTRREDYYSPSINIIVEDLHDDNVIFQDGTPFFIDTVCYYKENNDIINEFEPFYGITIKSKYIDESNLIEKCKEADSQGKTIIAEVEDEHIELFKKHGFKIKQ